MEDFRAFWKWTFFKDNPLIIEHNDNLILIISILIEIRLTIDSLWGLLWKKNSFKVFYVLENLFKELYEKCMPHKFLYWL